MKMVRSGRRSRELRTASPLLDGQFQPDTPPTPETTLPRDGVEAVHGVVTELILYLYDSLVVVLLLSVSSVVGFIVAVDGYDLSECAGLGISISLMIFAMTIAGHNSTRKSGDSVKWNTFQVLRTGLLSGSVLVNTLGYSWLAYSRGTAWKVWIDTVSYCVVVTTHTGALPLAACWYLVCWVIARRRGAA